MNPCGLRDTIESSRNCSKINSCIYAESGGQNAEQGPNWPTKHHTGMIWAHFVLGLIWERFCIHTDRNKARVWKNTVRERGMLSCPTPFLILPQFGGKISTLWPKNVSQRTYTATYFSLNSANPASCPHLSRTYTYTEQQCCHTVAQWTGLHVSLASVSDSRLREIQNMSDMGI